MLDFALTPEQLQSRARGRDLATRCIAPIADACDRDAHTPVELCQELIRQLMPRFLPDGNDASAPYLVEGVLLSEELAYASAGIASTITLPIFLNRLALLYLPVKRRNSFRQELLADGFITAFAASEADVGSDLVALRTRAERMGDYYLLTGEKAYSSNIRHARYVIVVARTAPGDDREASGFSWLLVAINSPGVEIGPRWETLGLRSMDLSPVRFDHVRVPVDHLLGDEGRGLWLMQQHLSESRTGIAAVGVGLARRARDEVFRYGQHRRVAGEKLTRLQDYRFELVGMEEDIAAAQALVWIAAARHDHGASQTKAGSLAKLYGAQMAMRVTTSAALMLGSSGYTRAHVVERLLRDARYVGIVEGPDPVQKEIIFSEMLRRGLS